ncbi:MAG: hypothetical protein AAB554_02170 [Patescibacteria group bacterium]
MQEEMLKRLVALVGDETQAKEIADKAAADGFTDIASCATVKEDEWVGYGMKKGAARKLLHELAAAVTPTASSAAVTMAASLLPQVPTDESFLSNLVSGGVLKPSENDVLAAIRALNADRYGIFDIDDKILEAIATRAEEMEEPWPDLYYDVQKKLAVKAHAEVLRALGVSSKVVSQAEVKKFLGRTNEIWSQLAGFYETVDGYVTNWQTQMGPQAMMAMMGALAGGGAVGPSPFAVEAPDPTPLVDQARGIIDRVNKMFAGPGIPVARALAADAQQLSDVLKKPELINAIGAANRDEMLKKLGIGVGADASRTETSVLQFALCVLKLSTIETSQLPRFVLAMRQVGSTIPWSTLTTGRGNGARDRTADSRYPRAPGDERGKTY